MKHKADPFPHNKNNDSQSEISEMIGKIIK